MSETRDEVEAIEDRMRQRVAAGLDVVERFKALVGETAFMSFVLTFLQHTQSHSHALSRLTMESSVTLSGWITEPRTTYFVADPPLPQEWELIKRELANGPVTVERRK